jgi:hypothetical protein
MSDQHPDDPQLRQHFTEQRRTDAQRAPAFEAVVGRPQEHSVLWLRPAIAFVVVALMAAVFVFDRQSPAKPEQLTASVLNWESPTAFLLETSATSPSDATSSIAEIVPQLSQETTSTTKETP